MIVLNAPAKGWYINHAIVMPMFQGEKRKREEEEEEQMEMFEIKLEKDEKGLGLTVAGYICEKGNYNQSLGFGCFIRIRIRVRLYSEHRNSKRNFSCNIYRHFQQFWSDPNTGFLFFNIFSSFMWTNGDPIQETNIYYLIL